MEDEICNVQREKVAKLLAVKTLIDETLRECEDELRNLPSSNVTIDELLEESLQIQFTCHASKEYRVGLPLIRCHPPAPQPEQMRVSELAKLNRSTLTSGPALQASGDQTGFCADSTKSFLILLKKELGGRKLHFIRGKRNVEEMMNTNVGNNNTEESLEPPANDMIEEIVEVISVDSPVRKTRKVTISFGMSDSDDDDSDGE